MADSCNTCFFAYKTFGASSNQYYCCRNAPGAPPGSANSNWSPVDPTFWCGEFSASDPNIYGGVKVPAFATAAPSTISDSALTQILSVALTTSGGNVLLIFTDNFQRSGGHSPTVQYILLRDGVQVGATFNGGGSGDPVYNTVAMLVMDTSVPAGAHTYSVQAYANGDPACTSEAPSLVAQEQ